MRNVIQSSFVGYNRVFGEGSNRPGISPDSLSSLQYWLDPVMNTIVSTGDGTMTSISNSGNAGGGFDWYPREAPLNNAKVQNFRFGSGDTKYYRFSNSNSQSVRILFKSMRNNNITAKTVISIAKRIQLGESAVWSISWTSDPQVNSGVADSIRHPKTLNGTTLDMAIQTSGGTDIVTPNSSIGSYVVGESAYTFFAATVSDGDWVNQTDTIKYQTQPQNSTFTSQSNPYTYDPNFYPIFMVHTSGGGYNPSFSLGNDDYAAVMVFDEVLTPFQISEIYQYYRERGYNLK